MDTINIVNYDVIACIPIYNESYEDLEKMLRSFKKDKSQLAFHLFFIIDGSNDTIEKLVKLLELNNTNFTNSKTFKYLTGKLSYENKKISRIIDFTLIAKTTNKGKHDSHILFFEILQNAVKKNPELLTKNKISILMLDSDTRFKSLAVKRLHKALWDKKNDEVGAITGMVFPRYNYLNPLECAQYYEYKVSHLLRKIAESRWGFVICIQGAFCLYKMKSLCVDSIIRDYGEPPKDPLEANNLLGEDRFLTVLLLHSGVRTSCDIKAMAYTTAPPTVQSFLLQRKRWNNSVLTSLIQIITKSFKRHSYLEKCYLFLIKLLIGLELLLIFLYPANWFQLIWEFSLRKALHAGSISWPVIGGFIGFMLSLIIIALLFNVTKFPKIWKAITIIIAVFNTIFFPWALYGLVVFISSYTTVYISPRLDEVMLIIAAILLSVFLSFRHGQFHLIDLYCSFWRLILIPVFAIIAPIYAFSRFDNFSWGTRGLDLEKATLGQKEISRKATYYKIALILLMIILNVAYLSLGVIISAKFLVWLFLFLSFVTFFPVLITSIMTNK